MVNETSEDKKVEIAKEYAEMRKNELIRQKAKELGVSEATFHKFKKYKSPIEKVENDEKKGSDENFEESFTPDNEDDEFQSKNKKIKKSDDDEEETDTDNEETKEDDEETETDNEEDEDIAIDFD